MDLAKPPDDPEQKNIIDKLANFVARNGPEFEQLTKAKQKDNPRFSFLFGGENFNYYQYRVTTEQAILKKQHQQQHQQQQQPQQHGMVPQSMPAAPWQSGPPPNTLPPPGLPPPGIPPPNLVTSVALPAISTAPPSVGSSNGVLPGLAVAVAPAVDTNQLQQQLQQKVQEQQQLEKTLEQKQTEFTTMKEQVMAQQAQANEQITQSNQNLAAQYQSLMQQQEMLCDQAVREMKENQLEKLAEDCDVTLTDLDNIVKPIIDSCTKDAISTGKNWIFSHNFSESHTKLITQYLLSRVTSKDATFELRLHLIYLINDVLHHCKRKNMDDLLLKFGKVVVPIFCTTHVTADDAKKAKLTKLLNLWRQNGYFPDAVTAMEDPGAALTNCQKEELEEFGDVVKGITKDIQQRYGGLNKQHQDFVNHVQSQITTNQTALTNAETAVKAMEAQLTGIKAAITALSSQMVPPKIEPPVTSEPPLTNVQGAPAGVPPFPPPRGFSGPPPNFQGPPPGFPGGPPPPGMPPGLPPGLPSAPPPTMGGPPIQLPDLSKPPPGFMSMPPGPPAPPPICEADLMPSVPYYELPAGLLAPLVKLDDSDYRPLIPSDIRLPPPMPPSDRLLAAVEAFYSAPSHERPRDAEGWEKLGLYEFFKAKQKAKKMRESEDRNRREQRDIMDRNEGNGRNMPKKRRYQEEQKRKRSRSKSPQANPKSGGSSPLPYQRSSRSRSKSRSKSPSRSRSRSKSRTPSPPRRRRSRSRSRSATPPSFFNEPFYQTNTDSRIGEENKGHQLMKKMGWGGGGLGTTEQGRVDPVEAAEVRDRTDMYKGIGTGMADPFEQFRKSKSQGYVNRMRVRAEPGGK